VRFRRYFFLLPILILSGTLLAQGQGASLHGTVIVPNGSAVVQATITVEGPAGGQAATTNGNGQYTMHGLNPGTYKMVMAAPGFDSFEVQVFLTEGTDKEIDAVMASTPKPPEPPVTETPASETPASGAQPENQNQPATPGAAPAQQPGTQPGFSVKAKPGRAALYGVVTDQSGAVVTNGIATLTWAAKSLTANANARGQYVFNELAPGPYKLSVSGEGFAPFVTELTLTADQSVEIDASLQPPNAKTEVNVEAGGPAQIQTESAHIEGTITEKEVLKTGLNGRNFTQLIALAPGVSNQTGQDEAAVGVKGSVKYSVNGGRVEYNNFDVDGSDVLNAGLNGAESTLMVYPSLDAIQEVKVLTSNYGAQYGRSASGTVLVTTKSGTPHFHGVLYDFLRNEFFNARNYFDQTKKAPLYRRQDFGGTIGGPLLKKDKAYFFWSEEFRLEKTPQEFNQAVPTAPERGIGVTNCHVDAQGMGGPGNCADFSDVCPFVGNGFAPIARGLYTDCPAGTLSPYETFPSNLVPINPTTKAILSTGMIPLPTSATGCNSSLAGTVNPSTNQPNIPCYDAVISPSTYWREELGRFDYNFTPNLRLSFHYIHDSWNTTVATPEWGYIQNSFPTVQNKLVGPGTSMVVRLTHTLSPSLLNEFVVGYVDSHITLRDSNGPGVNLQPITNCTATLAIGCMSHIFDNGAGGKPPGVVISGNNAQYGGTGFSVDPSYPPWEHTSPTYALSDNVSKSLGGGKHTLQFGVQVVDAQRNETNGAIGAATGDLQGILTFSNQNNLDTTGNAFADFLAGQGSLGCQADCGINAIKSYQQDSAQLKYYNDYWITEPYVQDDWHVNRHLTLNLGVRLSVFGNYHEKNLNAWNWLPSAYSPTVAATAEILQTASANAGYFVMRNGNPLPFDPTNPQSSLQPYASNAITNGLVQCGKNGIPSSCMSTKLFNPAPRIGFAWDPKGDGKTSIRGGYGMFFEHGTAKEANTGSLEGSSPLVLSMTDPFPFSYANIGLGGKNGTTPVAFPLDVTSVPTKTVWPDVQQWSLSVQRQLPKDMVATVAYVGSKGTHLTAELQVNQLPAPPTGSDIGIFLNGNPYHPGQAITAGDCAPHNNSPNNNPNDSFFMVNGITITQGEPAWTNLTAACYGTTNPTNGLVYQQIPDPNTLRPYFGFHRILSLQNIADSQYHALQATIRRTRGPLTMGASYTFSHSFDDSSDRSDASFVNSANIKSSWASSNFDQRHLLNFNYVYDLPKFARNFERWATYRDPEGGADGQAAPSASPDSKFLRELFDGWQVSGITVFQSGTPFSVINGGSPTGISVLDNAGVANGAGAGSYPDVVANPRSALPAGINKLNPQSIGPLLYNPAAFAAPQGLTFGNAGRNFLNNPHRINFDMSLLKNFKVTEGSNLEFRVEGFNVFNHTQFRIFNPNIPNAANNTISCYGGGTGGLPYTAAGGYTNVPGSGAGQPTLVDCTSGSSFLRPIDAHRPRTIQLGLKYSF
jgi:Carboxypeptidase regulatory-like domain/TonB-dependent Receptor Plug Domain